MTLIVFMLLVVIALAVGVRILEGGNKVALAVVLLVAAALGVRLISQSVIVQAEATTVLAAENDDQPVPATDAPPEAAQPIAEAEEAEAEEAEATSDIADAEPDTEDTADEDMADEATPDDGTADEQPVETVISDDPQAEIALEEEIVDAAAADTADSEIQFVKSTPPKVRVPPDWIDSEDIRTGDIDGVDMTSVSSGPQEHMGECGPELDKVLEQAVSDYVDEYLGHVYGGNFKASSVVNFEADYIRSNLVKESFDDKKDHFFGPMYQSHALIAFTPEFRRVLDGQRATADAQYRQFVVGGRLVGVGLVAGLILALLAVVSGYFRLDTATRGFYTARLQFLAAVAILAVIVAGALLARNVHWM